MSIPFEPASSLYVHVRGRQLEGTYSPDPDMGVWPITTLRVSRGWGNASITEWPYLKSPADWPPLEPPGIDALAKKRRIKLYGRVVNVSDCVVAIRRYMPVLASFEITDQWFTAKDGVITLPAQGDPIVGSHGIAIEGFDEDEQFLYFVNSWGKDWGVGGRGRMPFGYFDKYMNGAWVMSGIGQMPPIPKYEPGIQMLNWGYRDLLPTPFHAMEVYDHSQDERIAWAFATVRDGALDIEELFVKPSYRRQGYGTTLLNMIAEAQGLSGLPVTFWIPHPDHSSPNIAIVKRLLSKQGYVLVASDVRWASAKAVKGGSTSSPSPPITPPVTPRVFRPT